MLSKMKRYGEPNSHDLLKFAAIILMVIDHAGVYFYPEIPTLRAIGRASAPIWFFLIGLYKPTRRKHDLIFYFFLIGFSTLALKNVFYSSILISLLLARFLVDMVKRYRYERQGLLNILMLTILFYLPASLLPLQYSSLGFMLGVCGYLKRINYEPEKKQRDFFIAAATIYLVTQQFLLRFSIPDFAVMAIATLSVFYWLYNFRLAPLKLQLPIINKLIAVIGRYSLEIYVVHIIAFIYFSKVI